MMALRVAVCLALLVAPISCALLRSKKCPPGTKISISSANDAAGTLVYSDIDLVEDKCKLVQNSQIGHIKFCGPGKLTVSRMTCQSHEYKADTFEHSAKEYTTNCAEYTMEGTVAGAFANTDAWMG